MFYYISQNNKDKEKTTKYFAFSLTIISETSCFEFLSDFGRLKRE